MLHWRTCPERFEARDRAVGAPRVRLGLSATTVPGQAYMVETLPLTRARLESCRDMELVSHGVQLSVSVDGGTVADIGWGEARPGVQMSSDSIFRQHCTMKPVTAFAVARLVSQGAIGIDQPVSYFLPAFAQNNKDRISLRHLLTHTSGIAESGPRQLCRLPSPQEALDGVYRLSPRWVPGTRAAYCALGTWRALGAVVEKVVGGPLSTHLRQEVLLPLGMVDSYVGMTNEEWSSVEPRLGVNYLNRGDFDQDAGGPDMSEDGFFPISYEATEAACIDALPESGGYAPARDLARFYAALLSPDELADRSAVAAEVVRLFTSAQRRGMYDAVLLRVCDFGLGFMVDLREHNFGDRCSPSSYGHSGIAGSSMAFADPHHGLAVALVFNDLLDWQTAFLRRKGVINAIYQDLGFEKTEEVPAR